MEWIEITASTEHEALDRALDELGVHRDEAEWETLEVSKARLGGLLGRNEARVRARIKPVSREKPQTKRDRGGRSGGRGRRGGGNGSSKQEGAKNGGRNRGTQDSREQSGRQEPKKDGDAEGQKDGSGGRGSGGRGSRDRGANSRPSKKRGGGRGGDRARGGRSGTDDARNDDARNDDARNGRGRRDNNSDGKARGGQREGVAVNDGEERDEETVPIDEQAEIAEDFIEGLVDAFEVKADIDVDTDDDDWTLQISVEGGELGLLVGPGGATITAIEELTRTVLQRRTGGHAARVRVDVGGYKARRREALENFTRDLIAKVRESGRSQELEPMNAADRKTVHGVAADDEGVTTSSEGEEPRRRVVIHPA